MKQLGFILLSLLGLFAFWIPPPVHASCEVQSATLTYADGTFIGGDFCDTAGNKKVTTSGSAGVTATATAAAPSYAEASSSALSLDLSGNLRTTLGTLLSGEDQTNNLLNVSGGAVRVTTLLGSAGVPAAAGSDPATSAATILPVGKKTFQGLLTCTGTCAQTQKIYGASESSATVAKSVLVCTLVISASTSATDYCVTDVPFLYWFVVSSGHSGTTLLNGLFAMY